MIEHLLNPSQRRKALAKGQRIAAERRRKRRADPHSNKGRPKKESGVYYNHHILINEETLQYLTSQRYEHNEPIGAVLSRVLLKNIERKKVEARHRPNTADVSDVFFTNRHKSLDSILQAMSLEEPDIDESLDNIPEDADDGPNEDSDIPTDE